MATRGPDGKVPATAISNGISALHRERYGRGANRSRTHVNNDFVVTVMEDPFTTVEKTMIAQGAFERVRETRTLFQDWMGPAFIKIVEEATGRKVAQFFSQVGYDPDYAIECFLLESSSP
jgi:uncharacterized protein YbcI